MKLTWKDYEAEIDKAWDAWQVVIEEMQTYDGDDVQRAADLFFNYRHAAKEYEAANERLADYLERAASNTSHEG